jgi:hypothetical protein
MIMKLTKYLLLLMGCVLLSSCGPLRGKAVMSSVGLKHYTVTKGDVMKLKEVKNLLVVGPFFGKGTEEQTCTPKTKCIYPDNMDINFVTKYNDARRFAHGLQEAKLFETELYLDVDYSTINETIKHLKARTGPEIKGELNLRHAPEMILFGVVGKRDRKVAPLHGVVVDVQYELEFYNPDSHQSILIDVETINVFKEDMKTIIRETKKKMGIPITEAASDGKAAK